MRLGTTIAMLWALFVVPCFAGELEHGIALQERKEYRTAVVAFQRAAARGSVEAQRRLGFMYYHGEGVGQDNKAAVALFEKAAAAGDIQSMSNLAKMYEFGMGVAQDIERAAAWYLKGAESGDPASQFSASIMYYQGQGLARDRIEAAKWWMLALTPGGEWAEKVRASVESAERKLTPEELAEARRRAEAWQETRGARQ